MGRIETIQEAAKASEALFNMVEERNAALEEAAAGEETTRNPFKKMKNTAKKIGGIKGEVEDSFKFMKEVRDAKKELKQKRHEVLESATLKFSLIDYAKGKQRQGKDNRLLDVFDVSEIEGVCGAFVIATYNRIDIDKSLGDYKGVYVGQGENIRAEIDRAMSRAGDPDVYADVKYFQNVKIYLFDCLPTDLDTYYDSLIRAFADERLYNMREDDAIGVDAPADADSGEASGEASFVVGPMDEAPAEEVSAEVVEETPFDEAPAEGTSNEDAAE